MDEERERGSCRHADRHILGKVQFGLGEIEGRDRETQKQKDRETELKIKIPGKAG
jgi:hypothetical protein